VSGRPHCGAFDTVADGIGLDRYNGRIEILCEEMLCPTDPTADVNAPIRAAFREQYADSPIDEKVIENPVITFGVYSCSYSSLVS